MRYAYYAALFFFIVGFFTIFVASFFHYYPTPFSPIVLITVFSGFWTAMLRENI